MLSKEQATVIIENAFPREFRVEPAVVYKGRYLFQVYNDADPDEGSWDPYFTVDQETGEVRDFSIITDATPLEIAELYEQS